VLLSTGIAFAQSGNSVVNGQIQSIQSAPFNSGAKANRVAPMNAATRVEPQDVAESGARVADPPLGSAPFNSGGKANRIAPMNAATNSVLQGVHG
jgi:hypothetical protein